MTTRQVFLSRPTVLTRSQQQSFCHALRRELCRQRSRAASSVGTSDFTSQPPLRRILQLMDQCVGACILGLVQAHADTATIKPGTKEERIEHDVRYPTAWNPARSRNGPRPWPAPFHRLRGGCIRGTSLTRMSGGSFIACQNMERSDGSRVRLSNNRSRKRGMGLDRRAGRGSAISVYDQGLDRVEDGRNVESWPTHIERSRSWARWKRRKGPSGYKSEKSTPDHSRGTRRLAVGDGVRRRHAGLRSTEGSLDRPGPVCVPITGAVSTSAFGLVQPFAEPQAVPATGGHILGERCGAELAERLLTRYVLAGPPMVRAQVEMRTGGVTGLVVWFTSTEIPTRHPVQYRR